MKHLAEISKAPHPVGSAAHTQVRDYILRELSALGLTPEIQETTVSNVVARIKGARNSKAILLVGHYDTVENSPGASDDGSAVAVMLETARALQTHAPLNNDVVFLFSDGEETGLLGAKTFTSQHPWARDVGLVLNFEARGVNGPSIMFETSSGNGWLIREFAKAAPHPIASSFSYDVYQLLPNDTDLTVFKEAGFTGLNFAFLNGSQHYHAPTDDLAHLDERSVQHQGSYALALAHHFGNLDLTNTKAEDVVYFNLFGSTLIVYSQKAVIPFAAAVSLLFLACVAIGIRRQRLTLKGISSGFQAFLLSVGGGVLAAILIRFIADALHSVTNASENILLLLSVISIVAVTATVYLRASRRVVALDLMIGGMFGWLILVFLTSLFFKGGSYLFAWPLLFNSLAIGFTLLYRESAPPSILSAVVITLLAAPAILLIAPMIYLTSMALTINSLLFSIVAAVSVVLVTVPFIPLLHVLYSYRSAMTGSTLVARRAGK